MLSWESTWLVSIINKILFYVNELSRHRAQTNSTFKWCVLSCNQCWWSSELLRLLLAKRMRPPQCLHLGYLNAQFEVWFYFFYISFFLEMLSGDTTLSFTVMLSSSTHLWIQIIWLTSILLSVLLMSEIRCPITFFSLTLTKQRF